MKILVVSDTHGHDENLMRVLQREWPIDALIHCGDYRYLLQINESIGGVSQ